MKTAAKLKEILLNCLKPIPKVSVSSWADTFRMLPSDSPEPGRYKTARVPYFKEVQDAFTQPDVRRIAVKSAAQVGKALDVTTPIATPDGFKLMGDLVVGDKVFDENGEVCNVIGVSPIMYDYDCYEITFSEGAKIVADAEHNWYVQEDKRQGLKEYIKTTEDLSRDFKNGNRNRYAVPVAKPLKLPKKKLPIAPYTLGAWLGTKPDGCRTNDRMFLNSDDMEIVRRIEAEGYETADETLHWPDYTDDYVEIAIYGKKFDKHLEAFGLKVHNRIPFEYLCGSYEQRLELLRGLFDTDGTIKRNGHCEITQESKTMADGIMELLWTLGYKPKMQEKLATYTYNGEKKSSLVYRITFMAYDDVPVFHLQRKLARLKSRAGCRTTETFRRRIVNVERVESRPVKCIAVDSPNHLFLAGRELLVTKNSEVLLNIVGRTAHLDPANVMIIQPTLEMAQDFSKVRLAKMIADSKVLTPLFYDRVKSRDANQTILSKFYKGGRIILVGANSSSGLASRPIKILLCDEVDRYPASAQGEGDPIDLASKRTSNFFDAKIALFSTPTTEGASRIDVEYLMGTQEEWSHQCPNCGEWHCLSHNDMQAQIMWRIRTRRAIGA